MTMKIITTRHLQPLVIITRSSEAEMMCLPLAASLSACTEREWPKRRRCSSPEAVSHTRIVPVSLLDTTHLHTMQQELVG
jgi:hypothetical protein